MILPHEVLGCTSDNGGDGFDGLTGTNLTNKGGTMKHPTTNKQREK